MTMRSQTTNFTAPLTDDGIVLVAALATREEAAARLGCDPKDKGLQLVGMHEAHEEAVVVHWRREYDDEVVKPAKPNQPAKPAKRSKDEPDPVTGHRTESEIAGKPARTRRTKKRGKK